MNMNNYGLYIKDIDFYDKVGELVGLKGIVAYDALCRYAGCKHANKDTEHLTTIEEMAKKQCVRVGTMKRGIKKLEKFNIIEITDEYYVIQNKEDWNLNR